MTYREKLLAFGPDLRLSGMLTLPDEIDAASPALLLFNAGIVHRVGPHRLNVKIARALAEKGVASLRFDLSGLGDSAPSAEGASEAQKRADITAALDELGRACGARRFALAGLCSGADDAYRTALADRRIAGLALLDPYAYENRRAGLQRAAVKALDFERWKAKIARAAQRIETGPTVRAPVAGAVGAGAVVSGSVDDSSRPHPMIAEFGADLDTLANRGVKVLIVYTKFVEEQLTRAAHFFDTFSAFEFEGRIEVEVNGAIDHTYTELAAQRALIARLDSFMATLRVLETR